MSNPWLTKSRCNLSQQHTIETLARRVGFAPSSYQNVFDSLSYEDAQQLIGALDFVPLDKSSPAGETAQT